MKVMIFYDMENFKKSLTLTNNNRWYDLGKCQYFLINYIQRRIDKDCTNSSLVRVYAYTGAYSKNIIKRVKKDYEREKDGELKEYRKQLMTKTIKGLENQKHFLPISSKFNFFELKTTPLKYDGFRVFQKGIDVLLAVDLVSHAFNNNFDVAVVCSGDLDLLEAVKITKRLGKKVVIASHPEQLAKELRKEADYFLDLSRLTQEDLNTISKPKRPTTEKQ